jgi:hypothetical protein
MNTLQKRITRITQTTLIVGIDVAKEVHWARITDHRGVDLQKPIKVHNSIEGFENLLTIVKRLQTKHGSDHVIVGTEPSGHYWRALGWYLKLHDSKPELVGVNPYHTKQAKELNDNSQTKSDPKDALVIAHLIRNGNYFDTYLPEAEYSELRLLNTERQRIVKQINRANNTLVAMLDEYFPEYSTIWSNVTNPTSLDLLKTYTFPSDILPSSRSKLLEEIRRASKGKEGNKLMGEMLRVASRSVGVKEGLQSARLRILSLIDELEYFEKKKTIVEAELESVMGMLPLGDT